MGLGSRYEDDASQGASHFIERMAFKATTNRTSFRVVRDLSRLGCNPRTSLSRESVVFAADGLRSSAAGMLDVVADMARNPEFSAEDLEATQRFFGSEVELREGQALMDEAIASAAFSGETLGRPMQTSASAAEHMSLETLKTFHSARVQPGGLVVTGVGMAHEELVKLAQTYFGDMASGTAAPQVAAKYTGGQSMFAHEHHDGVNHIYVGWKSPHWNSDDLVVSCVINMMMGGGGSFSSGGPGKGMYSRMHLNVLNQHDYIQYANTVNNPYSDSAQFGFYLHAEPNKTADAIYVAIEEANKLKQAPSDAELSRAKLQLQSMIHFNLEARAMQFEDIGSQVLATGKYRSAAVLSAAIDKITPADVARVAKDMLASPLTYVVSGSKLQHAPRYDQVVNKL